MLLSSCFMHPPRQLRRGAIGEKCNQSIPQKPHNFHVYIQQKKQKSRICMPVVIFFPWSWLPMDTKTDIEYLITWTFLIWTIEKEYIEESINFAFAQLFFFCICFYIELDVSQNPCLWGISLTLITFSSPCLLLVYSTYSNLKHSTTFFICVLFRQ